MENKSKIRYEVGSPDIWELIENLSVGIPFSDIRLTFLNDLSKMIMSDKESRLYPDVITFAFWIRRANMERIKETYLSDRRLRLGRGVIFHIAPSNVAVNYAYSFAAGFITGNANIIRIPSKDFPQVEIINRALRKLIDDYREKEAAVDETDEFHKRGSESVKDMISGIVFVRYDREKEINDYLSSLCDVRVIWGGDNTISELRASSLKPRATEITFADRYSICVIDSKRYLSESETKKRKLASDFYNDTYLTDQNACTSPRLICWMGCSETAEKAKREFWPLLHETVKEKYSFQPVQFVDKLTELYLAAANIDGIHREKEDDNIITRINLDAVDEKIRDYRGNSGFFYEYTTEDILDLKPLCDEKMQTVSYFGDKSMLIPLIESGVKGIDRISEIGKTMDFDFIWDGYNLVERMTRTVGGV